MAKRDGGGPVRGMNKNGKTVPFVAPKGMPQLKNAPKPTEAIVAPGQKPSGLGQAKPNRFASNAKTPVVSSTSMSLRGMQGSSSFQPTKGQIIKAAGAVAGLGAATGFQIVKQTVVSEATKKLQRQLSQELKSRSDKDIRSMPKAKREEIAYSRATSRETPEEYLEDKAIPSQLQKKISESMKKTTVNKPKVTKRK